MKRNRQQEIRTWILFFVGLGLAYGLFRRGANPGPYWTLIIGTFVGLGVVISSALEKITGVIKEFKDDQTKPDGDADRRKEGPREGAVEDSDSPRRKPSSGDRRSRIRHALLH